MKFTKLTEAKVHDDYIAFQLEVEGVVRRFEISNDVLCQHFGSKDQSPTELLAAFERGADDLKRAANAAKPIPTDGVIELGSGDFEPTH